MDWCLYSSLEPKIKASRYDDGHSRFYHYPKNGGTKLATGITTVFSKVIPEGEYLMKWKLDNPNWLDLLDKSARYGSLEHQVFADIMMGKGVDMAAVKDMEKLITSVGGSRETPKKDILAFQRWTEEVELKPLVVEGILVWEDEDESLAMTIDLLAETFIKGKRKVQVPDGVYKRGKDKGKQKFKTVTTESSVRKVINVDFKSNFFEKERKSYFEGHKMQLIGASKAVYQNFGIVVDDIYNWSPNNWRDEPSYTFYKWDVDQKDIDIWNTYWRLACLKGHNKPTGKRLETTLKNSKDYKFLTLKDFIQ